MRAEGARCSPERYVLGMYGIWGDSDPDSWMDEWVAGWLNILRNDGIDIDADIARVKAAQLAGASEERPLIYRPQGPYLRYRPCDEGEGMRLRGNNMETEFMDDGVCGG